MSFHLFPAMLCACSVVAGAAAAPAAQHSITVQQAFARRYEQAWRQTAAYHWRARTEAIAGGEVLWVEVHEVGFGPQGELERRRVETQPPTAERSRRTRAKPVNRALRALTGEVVRLVSVCLGPNAMQEFAVRASVQSAPLQRAGSQVLVGEGAEPGEVVELSMDGDSKVPLRLDLRTSWQGRPLTMGIEFTQLRDGTTHVARIVAQAAPSGPRQPKLEVVMIHSGFTRVAS